MDTIAPEPPFDPRKKNDAVKFKPMNPVKTNQYQCVFQKGNDNTAYTINNKKLGIKIDGTNLPLKDNFNKPLGK